MQNGEGIRVSTTAVSGGSITVNVGPTDDVVEIGVLGGTATTTHHVPGDKDTLIPVPSAEAGSLLVVMVGKGKRKRRIVVTIVAPTP